ncbi:MAG: hypothetical protein U0L59_00905 [Faecalimonas sp.]|nr:hypothetical protein [Faecalimonas sp.]
MKKVINIIKKIFVWAIVLVAAGMMIYSRLNYRFILTCTERIGIPKT